jgi:hypothetical protein
MVDLPDHALAVSKPRDKFFGRAAQAHQGESCRAAGRGACLTLRESGRAQGCPAPCNIKSGARSHLRELNRGEIWKADQRQLFLFRDAFEGESRVKERGLFYSAHSV